MLISQDFIHQMIAKYGASLVGVMTGIESIGIPVPAEATLFAAAIYAGTTHQISIYAVVGATIAGAIIGDNIGYWIGRSVGFAILNKYGKHVGLDEDRLTLGRYLFQKHGSKVVIFGRFVALLRTLAAVLAGANKMPWGKFLIANATGGILWACVYGFGAYFLGNKIHDIAGPVGIVLLVVGVTAIIAGIIFMRKREVALIQTAKREIVR